MPKPSQVPDPTSWWETTPAESLIGSKAARLLASVDEAGRFDGPMTVFSAEGQPLIESHWKDGVQHGPQTIWRDPFYRTGEFVDGKPHGRWQLYWNEHALVWNDYDAGVITGAGRQNAIQRTISAKPVFLVNGESVASMEAALAMGDKVKTLGFSGWTESTLPDAIWDLKSLKELSIFYSQVRPIPAGIGRLENLEVLEIKGCNIGSIDPAIGALQNLRELKIIESGLGIFPAVKSPKLSSIDVSGNIMARIGHSLAECTALSSLKMRDNYIMSLDENVFSAPALRMVDMTGSFWLSWISPAVGDAKLLVNLTLYEQALLALPDELSKCAELQTLNLYGAHLAKAPEALAARTISQLNLTNTPLHAVPGYADFEAQLQQKWASKDAALAEHLAAENRTIGDLGFKPPKTIKAFDLVTCSDDWKLGEAGGNDTYTALLTQASEVQSAGFGCEWGEYPVQAFFGPNRSVDVPSTEVLIKLGILRPSDMDEFHTKSVRLEGSPFVQAMQALAPAEAWVLEVLPDSADDLKVGMMVLQLDDEVWAAVGPTLGKNDVFQASVDGFREFEPKDGKLREILMREIKKNGGAELCYHGLERHVGGPSTLVFEDTRHRVLAKCLTQAGVGMTRPFDVGRFKRGADMKTLGATLADLKSPRQLILGAVAVYPHIYFGQTASGEFAGICVNVVNT